ncbi:hypothetical protein BgiBS90_007923 [Biomphalaria glabrata]|nr:hypothetical protein BgiBS90_007923 [Biomphalaria glabrata]
MDRSSPMDEVDRVPVPRSQTPEVEDGFLLNTVNIKSGDRYNLPDSLRDCTPNALDVVIETHPEHDFIAVHDDIQQNMVVEFQGTVDHGYLWEKNQRQHNLATFKLETGEVTGTNCSTISFILTSNLVTELNFRKAFIYLFPETSKSMKLKVSSHERLRDETFVLNCENVPLEIFPKLQQLRSMKAASASYRPEQ